LTTDNALSTKDVLTYEISAHKIRTNGGAAGDERKKPRWAGLGRHPVKRFDPFSILGLRISSSEGHGQT
jgi:hypothetical protein